MLSVARGVFSPNARRWAIDRARGRFFSHAFRGVDPKVEDFFAHKDNHSDYLCALHTKKARRGLHISAIRGRYFVFITRIVCKSDTSFCSLRAGAALHSLPPRTSSVDDPRFRGHRTLFLHGEQTKELSFSLRWDEPMHKNGQTADGHTGCRSAVWPLLDRDRRAVAAHCGGRHRHRATTRGEA